MFLDASKQGKVMKLKSSLYGLRDAARAWSELLIKLITDRGLEPLKTAPCVFVKKRLVTLCYAKDSIMFAGKESDIDDVKLGRNNKLTVIDLKKPKRFLGKDFNWARHGSLTLTQRKLIEELLQHTGMSEAKAVISLINVSQMVKNNKECNPNEGELTVYQSIVGSLMLLTTKTQPNLSVAASMLASHLHNPTKINMINTKRALRYLRRTSNKEMNLRPGDNNQLLAYVDARWGNEAERNRGSRSNSWILYGQAVIIKTSSLQKGVSLSSTEAEYVALCDATKMIVWLKK